MGATTTFADIVTWELPETMEPGTFFPIAEMENKPSLHNPFGHVRNPFIGIFSCPRCAAYGMITRWQAHGFYPMICGSDHCSAEWVLRMKGEPNEEDFVIIIEYRRPM